MDLLETEWQVRWTELAQDHMHWSFKIRGAEPLSCAGTVFIGIIIIISSSSRTESLKLQSMKWQTCLQADFSLHWCPSADSCWEMWNTYFNFHHYGKYSLSPSICRFQGSGKAIKIARNQNVFKKYLLQQNIFSNVDLMKC